jgi:hypothetical protein
MWAKVADGGRDGSRGPKRMDMWQTRCQPAAFDLIIFTPGGLGTASKNQLEEKVFGLF